MVPESLFDAKSLWGGIEAKESQQARDAGGEKNTDFAALITICCQNAGPKGLLLELQDSFEMLEVSIAHTPNRRLRQQGSLGKTERNAF